MALHSRSALTMPTGHARARAMYERWVREHATELYRFAYRACGDRDVAEDLVQETFYQAWKCIGRLRHHDRARAWLYQILRHRYSRWRRAEKRGAPIQLDPAQMSAIAQSSGLKERMERDSLQHGLNNLSDRLKTPLLMVFMEGATCQETADRLDLPLGTVLSRIHRAKRRLREVLQDEASGAGSMKRGAPARFKIGGEP